MKLKFLQLFFCCCCLRTNSKNCFLNSYCCISGWTTLRMKLPPRRCQCHSLTLRRCWKNLKTSRYSSNDVLTVEKNYKVYFLERLFSSSSHLKIVAPTPGSKTATSYGLWDIYFLDCVNLTNSSKKTLRHSSWAVSFA